MFTDLLNIFYKKFFVKSCRFRLPNQHRKSKSIVAFTLAEMLIVIGIIGIIAETTIPTLIQNTQEETTVVKLKKVYSTLDNALNLAIQENGTTDTWEIEQLSDSADGSNKILQYFVPYLKIQKNCGVNGGCFANIKYRTLNGGLDVYQGFLNSFNNTTSSIRLADGTSIAYDFYGTYNASNNNYGTFIVDVNGDKPPNQFGIDTFLFLFEKNRIVPTGGPNDNLFTYSRSNCSIGGTGLGCTAWVIYNGNMDYLHCNDLSWNGKTKCN